jgi:putative ABC transport system permease protein
MTATPTIPTTPSMLRAPTRSARRLERGMGAGVLVAALSSAFGVVLISAAGYLEAMLRADPALGDSATLIFILGFLVTVLLGLAVYVASVVTANTFATVIAGRTRPIALLRLLGASARSQRVRLARQGLLVGTIGSAAGLVAGAAIAQAGIAVAARSLDFEVPYAVLRPSLPIPAAIVALTTWAAAWVGSRRVLSVAPLQALGVAVEPAYGDVVRRPARNAAALLLLIVGGALLVGGVLLGLVNPLGVVVAFVGGVFSFTGLAVGAVLLVPPLLRLVGRLFGGSAAARLAAGNALRYPERSSRMAIGVVIGVTLVTMLAVAAESVTARMAAAWDGPMPAEVQTPLDTFTAIMMGLVAVSAVIAAVGLVNLLTLGVLQRRRELGLLRTLGLSTGQVRWLVLLEAAHITATALSTGLVLGVGYGWVAAQSLLGSVSLGPGAGARLVPPMLPPGPILAVIGLTVALTLVAAAVSTRPATRVTPIDALADDR